jgi:3-oxoacyl-[acyl-carrier-protein] synthase-1
VNHDVHIVAIGARTPLGLTAESSIAAVHAGIAGLTEHPFILDRAAEPVRMAQDSQLDPALMGPERLIEMATTALEDVSRQLAAVSSVFASVPLRLCLPEPRPGWDDEDVKAVILAIGQKTFSVELQPVEVFSHGHAAGLLALDVACRRILDGREELSVIAGVDSYLRLETLDWLDRNRQLATSYHRGAFFPGEGAGAFVVASRSALQRCGLESLAVIRGVGIATEAHLIKTDSICLGDGLSDCVGKATQSLRLPGERVEAVVCDINGERYRSEEWGFTMLRLPETFVDPTAYDAPASCWGDMGAASGPLFVAVAVTAAKRGWAKGTRYLIWNSSEQGHRAAVVLEFTLQ